MSKFVIHIEDNKESAPRPHERRAAEILAEYLPELENISVRRGIRLRG